MFIPIFIFSICRQHDHSIGYWLLSQKYSFSIISFSDSCSTNLALNYGFCVAPALNIGSAASIIHETEMFILIIVCIGMPQCFYLCLFLSNNGKNTSKQVV